MEDLDQTQADQRRLHQQRLDLLQLVSLSCQLSYCCYVNGWILTYFISQYIQTYSARPPANGSERTLNPTTIDEELVYFNIKIDFFDGMGREPTSDEIEAMICQTNEFFKASVRASTNDPNVESFATNIDWEYDEQERLPMTVWFTSHTSDGRDKIIPAADIYNYILKEADAKSLVTDYIWNSEPYPNNIFYQTEDIMLGGSFSGSKKGRPIVPGKLAQAVCRGR